MGGEIASYQDFVKPITVANPDVTESRQLIERHETRGPDPDTAREVREAENQQCRAGLRNPHLCTQSGARPELKSTMARVASLLKGLRSQAPAFRNRTKCFGENPARQPPDKDHLRRARLALCRLLKVPESLLDEKNPNSCWIAGLFRALVTATADEDTIIPEWLHK